MTPDHAPDHAPDTHSSGSRSPVTLSAAPQIVGGIADIRERLAGARASATAAGGSGKVVLVPTMGALHAGHLALVRRAHSRGEIVVVSIFVNPLQFAPGEDLGTYPRTLEADISALAGEGVPFVFAPDAGEIYPEGQDGTRVVAGPIGSRLEGAVRPGHFDGVLTVVTKLINIIEPDVVAFGQKDAQQVFLITRMVADLDVPTRVEVVATVREPDGLALSSRNSYLNAAGRHDAAALSAALSAAQKAGGGVAAALAAARAVIDAAPLVKLDYLVVVNPETFQPVDDDHHGQARMLIAALVGSTRLIDNELLDI